MKAIDLVNRAAELLDTIEEGKEAAAELEAIGPALREALARHDGKAIDLYQHRHGWRTFLIENGVLRPIDPPEKIHSGELDEPQQGDEGEDDKAQQRPQALQAVAG